MVANVTPTQATSLAVAYAGLITALRHGSDYERQLWARELRLVQRETGIYLLLDTALVALLKCGEEQCK